jgi:tRNA pseudouridine38-40 synthase
MLHQIRKMISLVILATRTHTPSTLIPECFKAPQIHIPKAPALGLLLEQPIFDSHNANVKAGKFEGAKDGIDFELYREEMDKFKVEQIYERLREEEEATDT